VVGLLREAAAFKDQLQGLFPAGLAGFHDALDERVDVLPDLVLTSGRFPMWMALRGAELIVSIRGYARHPASIRLGKPEVRHEIWKDIYPLIQRVMETGEACWEEALQLILERSGFPEETYHTFSYSPWPGRTARSPECCAW